jgi:hypothetical protein
MKLILLIPPWITAMVARNQGRIFKIALLVLVFITALYTKDYRGEHQIIINNHIGGILYVLFGSLLFSVLFPRLKPYKPVLFALILTCLLEFIQYFRFPFMLGLTKHKVFAYLFGNSFDWYDFGYYFIGAALGFVLLFLLNHKET